MIHLRQSGYTLIEIMIAVAILAILSAIAIPIYQGYVTEGRYGAAIKDIRQIQLIMDDLALDNDLVALDAGDLTVRYVFTSGTGAVQLGDVAVCPPPSTTPPVPWCDPWQRQYRYQRLVPPPGTPPVPQPYRLFSAGPDGVAGNADDVDKD